MTQKGSIVVTITDTGIGIAPEEIAHIFDAFSQGDHAVDGGSHRFGGLGLGLSISRMLVKLHSGLLYATSAGRNQGATFTVELPFIKVEEKKGFELPAPLTNGSHSTLKPEAGMRVLLVEDHEPTRSALAALLTRRQYKVFSAASVGEARALTEHETFDLLISDIGLPDGDGYSLMSELRKEFGLKGIALTGYGMEQDLARGQHAGFVAHLIKPVRIEALETVLSQLTRGAG